MELFILLFRKLHSCAIQLAWISIGLLAAMGFILLMRKNYAFIHVVAVDFFQLTRLKYGNSHGLVSCGCSREFIVDQYVPMASRHF